MLEQGSYEIISFSRGDKNLSLVKEKLDKNFSKVHFKKKLYPLGRIGDAKKDIAPTIEFLLSDKSLWTTGAIYLVDGGKSV